jgi:hypothetical protein
VTPESAGSVVKYLRQKPSWRGLLDLVDVTKPVPKPDLPAAMAFESRKEVNVTPRAFVDPTSHEPSLRVF